MNLIQQLYFLTGAIWFFFTVCLLIGVFYLGRRHVKAVDKLVYGSTIPNDSIFFQLLRIPNYGGAFSWKFSARRNRLEAMVKQFDSAFKRPFIITFWCMVAGFISFIAMVILQHFAHI